MTDTRRYASIGAILVVLYGVFRTVTGQNGIDTPAGFFGYIGMAALLGAALGWGVAFLRRSLR
jgi:hypothetical protein